MSNTLVHNISDRVAGVEAHAVILGRISIRPGKHASVPTKSINNKHYALHGSVLWFGDIPKSLLISTPTPIQGTAALSYDEAKEHLLSLPLESLYTLADSITPAVTSSTRKGYIYSILSACFLKKADLDPEAFMWLNRWEKLPNGDFMEK